MPGGRSIPARRPHRDTDRPLTRAVDFLVWKGYPPDWVMGLTLRQFLAFLDAAAKRAALTGKTAAAGLLTGRT